MLIEGCPLLLNGFIDWELNNEEKDKISPGCKLCQSRCGNTDDIFVEMKEDSFMKKSFDLCFQTKNASLVLEAFARISYQMDDAEYKDIYRRLKESV